MPEDCDHARSQAGHHGMGVRTTGIFLTEEILAVISPATDDPIVPIAIVMGISGSLMLGLGILRIVEWIRRKREEKNK